MTSANCAKDAVPGHQLRQDPVLCALAGKETWGETLAGKSTHSRLEPSTCSAAAADRYKRIALDTSAVDELLVAAFLESHSAPPDSIVIHMAEP